jgi:hypothetical protein
MGDLELFATMQLGGRIDELLRCYDELWGEGSQPPRTAVSSMALTMSIAELLPRVRGILPLTDIDALNRLTTTLCDVLETTLAVPPAPTNEAVAVPALTPQEFLFSALLDGPQPAKAVERAAREQHGWPPRVLF